MSVDSKNPETIALHAGYRADPTTGAVAVPIYQTTSYQFDSTEHAANLFALKELGNIYTRIMNPTVDVLEQRIAALEGGVAALALGSGQAASAFSIQNIAPSGDNIISSTDLYGGTWNLFANTFKAMGIEVRFVDPAEPKAFAEATDGKTRAYYAETLPNPKLKVFPISEVAEIGHKLGVPLIMDNTACPVLCRPLDHGLHRHLFDDQVHRRPWHLNRRTGSRWRQFRLGGTFRALPDVEPALLIWRGLDRSGQLMGPIAYNLSLHGDLGAYVPLQRFYVSARARDRATSHPRAFQERRYRCQFLSKRDDVTTVIYPTLHADKKASKNSKVPIWRQRRTCWLRAERRIRRGTCFHRSWDVPSRCQYRRCPFVGYSSGNYNTFSAYARRTSCQRRYRWLCAPIRGHRAY